MFARWSAPAAALLVLAACGEEPLGPSVLDGRYTLAQAQRGSAVFAEHCLSCHGESLMGVDDFVPPISEQEFQEAWEGKSLGALYWYVSNMMPFERAATLTGQQYADVLAYVLFYNGYPAGTEELAVDGAPLGGIKFVTLPSE